MITNYYRPQTVQDAMDLLSDPGKNAIPLGGGTHVSQIKNQAVSVVDLQNLGLDQITAAGNNLRIGGTATLQAFLTNASIPETLREPVAKETNFNIRQKATVAGTIITGDGRSPFLTALLALDGSLTWLPGPIDQNLGEFLLTRDQSFSGKLLINITIPLNANVQFESVARTAGDRPVLCIAVAKWPSGRLRIALGGFGKAPVIALDAPDAGGVEFAVRDALTRSGDVWASAEYRQEAAAALVKRMVK